MSQYASKQGKFGSLEATFLFIFLPCMWGLGLQNESPSLEMRVFLYNNQPQKQHWPHCFGFGGLSCFPKVKKKTQESPAQKQKLGSRTHTHTLFSSLEGEFWVFCPVDWVCLSGHPVLNKKPGKPWQNLHTLVFCWAPWNLGQAKQALPDVVWGPEEKV